MTSGFKTKLDLGNRIKPQGYGLKKALVLESLNSSSLNMDIYLALFVQAQDRLKRLSVL
jgi:hypothetical protein